MEETIHYSSTLSLLVLKSQGQGECGKQGFISGYKGAVSCKPCLKIMQKEKATLAEAKAGLFKGLFQG